MKYLRIIPALALFLLLGKALGQNAGIIVLGDLHYDRLDLHDWGYVMKRPQDMRQIMNEYPQYTAVYMPIFLNTIKNQADNHRTDVKAIVQLGDLVEGVAGTHELSLKMNNGVVEMLHSFNMPVPIVLVKGNHDVSNSPGQPEAWREVIMPFMEGQLNQCVNDGMYRYSLSEHADLFVLDQFFSTDRDRSEAEMVEWLEKELSQSCATYKFILTHQPVIPVTGRCWHLLSGLRRKVEDPDLRERFLNLLGSHRAVILCAHLHKYSVLCRKTDSGPIVQIMINSVNRGIDNPMPDTIDTLFQGRGFVDQEPSFNPSTDIIRSKILENEKKYIKYFLRADMPGYAIISFNDIGDEVTLEYYNGISQTPYHTINITDIQTKGL